MPLSVYAPAKLVLLGEYAVLNGAPALVAAVNRRVIVTVTPCNDGFRLTLPHVGVTNLAIADRPDHATTSGLDLAPSARSSVQSVLALMRWLQTRISVEGGRFPGMHLSIDAGELYASEGIKLGLGSSAAVTVALMTGMYAHLSARQPKRSQIFDMALAAHRHLQNGRGSGLDVAASVFGGTIEFQLSQDQNDRPAVHPVRLPGRMFLSTVWTGQPASTPQMLNALEAFRDDQGSRYRDVLEALAATARRGTEAFHREDVVQFFKAVEGYHQQLTRLSEYSGLPIVSEEHSSLAAIARDNGGVYKPSGAGGGDIGIAFADTARKAERISLAMTDAGFRVLDLEWGAMGVRF